MMEHSATTVLPPSELGNPQRTRVSTFPQRRRLRLSNWGKVPNPRQSHISTDSRAEPFSESMAIMGLISRAIDKLVDKLPRWAKLICAVFVVREHILHRPPRLPLFSTTCDL